MDFCVEAAERVKEKRNPKSENKRTIIIEHLRRNILFIVIEY